MCRVFNLAEENGEEPPDHVCPKNYNSSSKAMEVDTDMHLYKEKYNSSKKRLYLNVVVADDESSMRALLRHRSLNPKWKLPEDMLVPDWLAYPSHRTKVVAKSIYLLASLSKSASSCTKLDAIKIKNYFGYMIKTNIKSSIFQNMIAYKVVVERLFDNHEFFDVKWWKGEVRILFNYIIVVK